MSSNFGTSALRLSENPATLLGNSSGPFACQSFLPMKPDEAVLKFLESVGRGSETEYYLRLFRSEDKESFAAICVASSTVRHALDAVVLDLSCLAALGLTPVVVLGLHDAEHAGVNLRQLADRLGAAQVPFAALPPGSDPTEVAAAARGGALAVTAVQGSDENERFACLAALLTALRTRKLIFLQDEGGLRRQGHLLSLVNLSTEFEVLLGCSELTEPHRRLLAWSHKLIFELVPHRLLIAATSPLNLLRELFTVKGAGTLLRKGSQVSVYSGVQDLNVARLRELLEAAFGRPLATDFFSRPISRAYLEHDYRGAGLVVETGLGGYLTKFAVTRQAQGEGIGHDIWKRICDDYPTLLWRASPHNPITPWYERQCDGRVKAGQWTVYFKGLQAAQIPEAIRSALRQPIDL